MNTSPSLSLYDTLYRLAYVPVIEIDHADSAVPLANALLEGGIGCAEITLRTSAGLASIEAMAKANLPILVGAGSLTRAEHAAQCKGAGASFGVSPGFTRALGDACKAVKLPLLPGTVTPSEVMFALDAEIEILKFFPASIYGGTAWLKAISGPIAQAKFCPTGGIKDSDIADYLSGSNVVCFGSSGVATAELIKAKNWTEITHKAKAIMAIVRAARS